MLMLHRSIGEIAWAGPPRGLGKRSSTQSTVRGSRSPGRSHGGGEVGAGSSASSSADDARLNSRQIEHSGRAVRSAPDSDNTASSQRKSRDICGVRERSRASEAVASTAPDPVNNSGPNNRRQSVLSTQRRGSRRSCPRLSTRSPHTAVAYIIHIMRSDVAVDARFRRGRHRARPLPTVPPRHSAATAAASRTLPFVPPSARSVQPEALMPVMHVHSSPQHRGRSMDRDASDGHLPRAQAPLDRSRWPKRSSLSTRPTAHAAHRPTPPTLRITTCTDEHLSPRQAMTHIHGSRIL
jgi:hypothetical protein